MLQTSTADLPQLKLVSISVDLIRSWAEKLGMSRQRQWRDADTCRRFSSPANHSSVPQGNWRPPIVHGIARCFKTFSVRRRTAPGSERELPEIPVAVFPTGP